MNENENQVVEENVSTPDTPEEVSAVSETQVVDEPTFTKSQINELMKRRVAKTHNSFFKRYGVANLQELDDRFNSIEKLQAQIGENQLKYDELFRTNVFLRNQIKPDKYDDVIAICGDDFSEEKLIELLKTHPEWVNQPDYKTSLMKFGKEQGQQDLTTERDEIDRLFGKF